MKNETEWQQFNARIPKDLHTNAKIASVVLGKSMADMLVEALEKAIAEAGVKAWALKNQ